MILSCATWYAHLARQPTISSTAEVGENDIQAHEARIRATMLREDWPQVVNWIAALPQHEREDESWTYWLARARGYRRYPGANALYEKPHERTYMVLRRRPHWHRVPSRPYRNTSPLR